jgi:hypothetical protein
MKKILSFIVAHLIASFSFSLVYSIPQTLSEYNESNFLQSNESIFPYVLFCAILFRLLALWLGNIFTIGIQHKLKTTIIIHGVIIIFLWSINPTLKVLLSFVIDALIFNVVRIRLNEILSKTN